RNSLGVGHRGQAPAPGRGSSCPWAHPPAPFLPPLPAPGRGPARRLGRLERAEPAFPPRRVDPGRGVVALTRGMDDPQTPSVDVALQHTAARGGPLWRGGDRAALIGAPFRRLLEGPRPEAPPGAPGLRFG